MTTYKSHPINQLFDIHPTKAYKLTNAFLFNDGGKTPVVTNTSKNYGRAGYSNLEPTEHDIITFSDTGTKSPDSFFFQEGAFIGYPHVQGMYPLSDKWNKYSLMYLVTLLKMKTAGIYDYSTKMSRDDILKIEIMLPVKDYNTIDYDFMEKQMREIEEKHILKIDSYLKACDLDHAELTKDEKEAIVKMQNGEIRWKEFKVCGDDGIFDVNNTHSILQSQIVPESGKYPYCTASEENNSVSTYIDYDEEKREKGNSIMIGGKTLVVTYQESDYFSNDSHNIACYVKDQNGTSKEAQLFLISSLYKTMKPKYSWGDSISGKKITEDSLFLPVAEDDMIDWDFMKSFIDAEKRMAVRGVIKWKNKVLGEDKEKI